jgi:hypothetical protein
MSRNSKTAKRLVAAKQISAQRKNGNKGPAATTPKHNKKKAWWQMFPSYGAYLRGGKRQKAEE